MHELIAAVAVLFGLSAPELISSSRRRDVAQARQAAAWVLRQAYPLLSLEAIGQLLGGRDHTTIGYALDRVEDRMLRDHALAEQLYALISQPAPIPTPAAPISHAMRWWGAQGRSSFFVPAA